MLWLIVGLLVFRRLQKRVVALPSPHPRRLGPEESAAGKQALTRALELILAARDRGEPGWQGFEPANYPHVVVRGDKQRANVYWIYFSLRIWYVPAGGEVVTSFNVGVIPKGLEGHSSYSLDCNDYGAPSEPRQPFSHSFWKETDETREALNFVDQAIRQHADFGVYGNLTAGIEALAQAGCTVGVRQNEDGYSVHVNPIDGHGHFHHFQVFSDGRVGESACGHMDPMPEDL
jgi:hypothetical protein